MGCSIMQEQESEQMKKFKWLPTESAFADYPMEIIKGNFIFTDNSSVYIPNGKVINNGWGERGSLHILKNKLNSIPIQLDITWFSYVEDKFYSGSYLLPYEKILDLFEQSASHLVTRKIKKIRIPYDGITIGLAPEGEISIWLTAQEQVVEIANYTASEIDIDWKNIIDHKSFSRSHYINEVFRETLDPQQIKYIKSDDYQFPTGISKRYRKQYIWGVDLAGIKPIALWVKTFNGENELFFTPDTTKRRYRSVPKKITIHWKAKNRHKYTVTFHLEEEQIFSIFEGLNHHQENVLQLQVVLDNRHPCINIILVETDTLFKLNITEQAIYKMT